MGKIDKSFDGSDCHIRCCFDVWCNHFPYANWAAAAQGLISLHHNQHARETRSVSVRFFNTYIHSFEQYTLHSTLFSSVPFSLGSSEPLAWRMYLECEPDSLPDPSSVRPFPKCPTRTSDVRGPHLLMISPAQITQNSCAVGLRLVRWSAVLRVRILTAPSRRVHLWLCSRLLRRELIFSLRDPYSQPPTAALIVLREETLSLHLYHMSCRHLLSLNWIQWKCWHCSS